MSEWHEGPSTPGQQGQRPDAQPPLSRHYTGAASTAGLPTTVPATSPLSAVPPVSAASATTATAPAPIIGRLAPVVLSHHAPGRHVERAAHGSFHHCDRLHNLAHRGRSWRYKQWPDRNRRQCWIAYHCTDCGRVPDCRPHRHTERAATHLYGGARRDSGRLHRCLRRADVQGADSLVHVHRVRWQYDHLLLLQRARRQRWTAATG
jgi:hypothetical protein